MKEEYWNSMLTEKSWNLLQELKNSYKFVLIGGWATYLWTKQQKSKDIDIVVDLNELQKLKSERLGKNDKLKKYEIKKEDVDIDIYVSYYSELTIPVSEVLKESVKVEGFDVVKPEVLVILKQGAEKNREHGMKGEKDRIDIVSLLFFTKFDFKKYNEFLKKYSLLDYMDRLSGIVRGFFDCNVLGLTPRELKLKKKEIIGRLRKT